MKNANSAKMDLRKRVMQSMLGGLLLTSGTFAFAGVSCTPNGGVSSGGTAWNPSPEVFIDMNTVPGSVPPGTLLGVANTGLFLWRCVFSGTEQQRTIWFNNQTPQDIKKLLLNSGVRLYQEGPYGGTTVEVTQTNTPPLVVGSWAAGAPNIVFGYKYKIIRGSGELKSFDTGVFPVGYHRDYQGKSFGDMYYARIIGKLVNYCPTPIVIMNNKVVDFKELTPENFQSGKTVKENFSLDLVPDSTCNTALEVSVAFQSNSGVINKKYMLFNNGLQAVITDKSTNQVVSFDQYYYKGSITQQRPGYFQYSVELSNKDNEPIKSGPFSNTVNVLFSYR